jgi:hypothetical protein
MGSGSARALLVILAGLAIGAWLIVSTLYQMRLQAHYALAEGRLHPVEAAARLALGVSLVLLAVFLLAARTLWADAAASAAPAWAAPVGLVILAAVPLAGVVVGAFAAARRLRPKPR